VHEPALIWQLGEAGSGPHVSVWPPLALLCIHDRPLRHGRKQPRLLSCCNDWQSSFSRIGNTQQAWHLPGLIRNDITCLPECAWDLASERLEAYSCGWGGCLS